MTELLEFILIGIIIIGLSVFFGWVLWGQDVKYYKNLAETYKKKLTSQDQDVDIKDVIIRYLKNREIEIER